MPLLLGSKPRRYVALIPHEASTETQARPACSSPRRGLHPQRVPLGCWVQGAPLQLWSRVLGPTGTAVPQTRPPTPLGIWGASGHDPAPPRVASFRVESLSGRRPLSPDAAQLCRDRCGQSSNHHPQAVGATFLGHASGSLQLLLFRVETLGEWLKPQATPPLELSPPSPIYQNSIHLRHQHHRNLRLDHLSQVLLGKRLCDGRHSTDSTKIGPNCLSPLGHTRPPLCSPHVLPSANITFRKGQAATLGVELSSSLGGAGAPSRMDVTSVKGAHLFLSFRRSHVTPVLNQVYLGFGGTC